ncbi:Uncharacterized protein YjbI, contains pentapeptide repeats [Dyadobacter sp. SG02]|uniref:pentapeptide repeat-containing protein n=1 Tax=Dyadobacter sp. SG02 TaxID=1855291 RepID=UPI0008BE28EE|nr:pentapeptide repeat-containing protein [Dyadobacter sp. SG02]SEI54244.1 Uncharacterized protein YjbI, contains pentapeptide repeats [Dyadobacter sp. SG02]
MEPNLVGNKIVAARKQANLSQSQLAEQLFISPQAVGKWERGESVPDIITVTKLAQILGVDLNYFSEGFTSAGTENTTPGHSTKAGEEVAIAKQSGKPNWDMSRGNWVDADFSGLKNLHEKFASSNLQRSKFIGSDMSNLIMKANNVESCDFSKSDLSNSQFENSHLVSNTFNECLLQEARFSGSYLKGCDFTNADLTGTHFRRSSLLKTILANAILNRTSFDETDLSAIIFNGVVQDCTFDNCSFSKVIFQDAKLINTFFKGKGMKNIRFENCEADRLTYEFLKSGKADLTGVSLMTE